MSTGFCLLFKPKKSFIEIGAGPFATFSLVRNNRLSLSRIRIRGKMRSDDQSTFDLTRSSVRSHFQTLSNQVSARNPNHFSSKSARPF